MLRGIPKSLTVRLLIGCVFALGCWMAYVRTRIPRPDALALRQLAGGLYEIQGDGGNVTLYVTSEGVVLVDDMYEHDFANIRAAISSVTTAPVRYVFNTHHHGDHIGSNEQFLHLAQVISTANARANIVDDPANAPAGFPAQVYETGMRLLLPPRPWRNRARLQAARVVFTRETSVRLGGKEVRALYLGRGHTNGDAVIYFPELRAIAAGDLMANDSPLIDYSHGGSLIEWIKTLDEMLKLDFDIVIPGHGAVSNKAGLVAYRKNAERLRTRVTDLVREGKGREEISRVMNAEFGWAPGSLNMQFNVPGMMAELAMP